MAEYLTSGDLERSRPVFLLDFTWGGRTFHLSSEPVVLESDDGDRPYEGGLDLGTYRETLDRLDDAIPGQSAGIECVLPIDVLLHRRRGHDLNTAFGELSMVTVRPSNRPIATAVQTYERRIRLMTGNATSPEYGDPEHPAGWVSFTLEEPTWEDAATIIPAEARINDTTWPNHLNDHDGKVYPMPIGEAGHYTSPTGASKTTSGSPAYVVDDTLGSEKLLIAGQRVQATTAIVFDSTDSESLAITHEDDGLGRTCAVIDLTTASTIDPTETEFWIGWNADGGILSPYESGADLKLAGHVARYILSRSTIPQDWGRWSVAASFLNRIELATYINDPDATPWDWVADNLLDLLPMSLARSPDGVYPVVFDLDLAREDMVQITEGEDFRRVSGWTSEGSVSDTRNYFALDYAPRAKASGTYRRRIILTPTPDPDDPEQTTNAYVELSHGRYRSSTTPHEPPKPTIRPWQASSDILYSSTAATQVVMWLSRLRGFLPEVATYAAAHQWGWLRAGRSVSVTEAAAHQSEHVGWVVDRYWDGTRWTFTLLFDDDPARDTRATS